jgi:hypothetical protein
MKPKAKKRRGAPVDKFATFKNAVSESFAFLITDFGFKLGKITIASTECQMKYWNETTSVKVTYDWKSVIWFYIGRLDLNSEEGEEIESYSVDSLLLERCPDRHTNDYYCAQGNWSEDHIKWILENYASDLRACGEDILAGKFRIFPALKRQTAKILKRKNEMIFGAAKRK